jgi:hypothetical protein
MVYSNAMNLKEFMAVGRYLVSGWMQTLFKNPFPFGTLAVNSIGSLLIGLVVAGIPACPHFRYTTTINLKKNSIPVCLLFYYCYSGYIQVSKHCPRFFNKF